MIFRNVQAMRGVAALLVAVMHVVQSVNALYLGNGADSGVLAILAPALQSLGIIGVDLFFVISGFVLFLAAHRAGGRVRPGGSPAAAGHFALNRLIRIYPLYWVVFLVTATTSSIAIPGSFSTAIANLPELFLVDWENSYAVVPPAWTLMYELYFYVWMSLAILLVPRRLPAAILVWLAAHVALIGAARLSLIAPIALVTDPILIDFGAGAIIAMLVLKGRTNHAGPALAAAAVFLAAGLWFMSYHFDTGAVDRLPRLLTFGAFAICAIYGIVALELRKRFVLGERQPFGDASYSLYLWHVTVYWTLNWTGALSGFYDYQHPYLTAAIWFAVALPVGLLSYRWIEKPLLDLVRRRRAPAIAAQPA